MGLRFQDRVPQSSSFIERSGAARAWRHLADIFTMGARPWRDGTLRLDRSKLVWSGRLARQHRTLASTSSKDIHRINRCARGVVSGSHRMQLFRSSNLAARKLRLALRQSAGECFRSGLGPARSDLLRQRSGEGNPVIYVGSKTGRDGITAPPWPVRNSARPLRPSGPISGRRSFSGKAFT